ncbi:MAG: dipeptide/oligopeptide/nickel ABC transporter ATP-binding protein [Candidatus Omnitrophica bacterium]|nr:dipeptide/oligopeptide/nickel ABC transporter ATP-binding protein [Candidatus Omnitrophota bacterium]
MNPEKPFSPEPSFCLRGITKIYCGQDGTRSCALEGVTFSFKRGTTYAIVGESGSGKTTLGRVLAGLVPVTEGEIIFEGRGLATWHLKARKLFCKRVQMIFQNPFLSLDPYWSVSSILEEGMRDMTPQQKKDKVLEMMTQVRLPEHYLKRLPRALSGGERQRVAIARSLLVEPDYLILDEPTSQLDVTNQFEIMALLEELKKTLRGGLFFITHNIALASRLADEILVLRQGRVLESGLKKEVILAAQQEYTQELLASVPRWPPVFR